MERRLAAVLFADVVDYGKHSQRDEEGTRARFQADLRDLFEPAIADHHGRLVKTIGDAVLAEFHSIVDAVRCAVRLQRAKSERMAEGDLAYRIGINLGDVIVEGDDIHGDGVNIGERLQRLAEAGGIVISGTAYDQVEQKLEAGYKFLGEKRLKNVDRPVRVYRVLLRPDQAGKTIGGKRRPMAFWPAAIAAAVALAIAAAAWWKPWVPEIEGAAAAG